MELEVLNIKGEKTGRKVNLSDSVFKVEPNDHLLYLAVKSYLANQRQGTHKAKEKSEVSGSTRKLKRQKGTGTARAGSIKNPLFVGGARVFGPRPRTYGFKLNKKERRLARFSALAYKAKENKILVLEDFNLAQPKTKEILSLMKNLGLDGQKQLLVLSEPKSPIVLSARNLPKTNVELVSNLNPYTIMNHQVIVFSESAIPVINENN